MKVFGIIGDHRVAGSLSPAMHNQAMRRHGISGVYVKFAVQGNRMPEAMAGLRALGIAGVNVTVPYKEAAAKYMDRLEGDAAILGVVNTVLHSGDELIGHNTDAEGLAEAVRHAGQDLAAGRGLVIGAGGAARAAAHALGKLGCAEVIMAGRDLAKVEPVAKGLGIQAASLEQAAKQLPEVGVLINATSVSSLEEGPGLAAWVEGLTLTPQTRLVIDLNYGRQRNIWQGLAARAGVGFMDGLPMLAHQARRSFALWTGINPDVNEFLSALGVAS